jgi:hypothetical protein
MAEPICGKANVSMLAAPVRAKTAVVPAQNTPERTCVTVTRTNIHVMITFLMHNSIYGMYTHSQERAR